jgi:Mor family transcriptional regulator
MELKKDALSKLGPLVDKLDQSPEEKFKTTMMMIQASDDKTLIPKAYDAANSIVDEKTKAQALLDIINEINYFTSGSNKD